MQSEWLMAEVLKLENITRTFAGPRADVRAVDDVCLSLAEGDFTAIVGPSGCGKSTLLLCAGGLLRPNSGRVTIDGQDPYSLTSDARARLRAQAVGFVFQQFHLVPFLSVRDNILAPAMALTGSSADAAGGRADELIEHFGLTSRRDHTPAALSSGERQRTALARALLNKPKLLLADEPTGNLDAENGQVVLQHLREFAAAGGAVLLVTHDTDAVAMAGTTIRLRDGRIVENEPAAVNA